MSDNERHVYRSSITGKIVAEAYAELHPDTTYRDTITTYDSPSDSQPGPAEPAAEETS